MNFNDFLQQAGPQAQQLGPMARQMTRAARRLPAQPRQQLMAPQPARGADPNLGLLMLASGKLQAHYDMSGNLINPAQPQLRGLDAHYAMQRRDPSGALPNAPTASPMPSVAPRQPLPPQEPLQTQFFNADTDAMLQSAESPLQAQYIRSRMNPQGFMGARSLTYKTGIDPVTGEPTMVPHGLPWVQNMFGAQPPGISSFLSSLRTNPPR